MAALGLILGLVGSVTTKVFGIFEKREERLMRQAELAHEVNRWAFEKEMFTLQSQAKVAETEQEAFLMTVQGSYDGLKASIENQTEATKGTSRWVKNLLSTVRPTLTFVFSGILIYNAIWEASGDYRLAALTASIDLAMMSVCWWFGDRSTKRVIDSMRGNHIRGAGGNF